MFVNICVADNSTKTCLISKNVYDSLDLTSDIEYILKFGQKEVLVNFQFSDESKYILEIPKEVFNKIRLVNNIRLNIWKEDEIHLGPVIGIVEDRRYVNALGEGNLHIRGLRYSEESINRNYFTYFFSSSGIDLISNSINGYYLDLLKKQWIKEVLPIPDVIYARKGSSLIQNTLRDFKNVKYINNNNDSINKGTVYTRLSKYPEISCYLPATKVYESFRDIEDMIKTYKFVFLKSFYGASGIEVLSIEQVNNYFEVNFFSKSEMEQKMIRCNKLSKIQPLVKKFFHKKNFVVQQGLKLFNFNGKKMDLRVLIQRNKEGIWQVTAYLPRLAKESLQITNSCIGGTVANYDEIFSETNQEEYNPLPSKERIGETTIMIATYIEKEFGNLGEIGMDIGIDHKGNIWFIEANLGPSNVYIENLNEDEMVNQYSTLLEYGDYLVKARK